MRYTFGNCVLDTQRIVLYRAGQAIHLRPKVFHLLTFLLGHCDRVISKDELCHAIWPEQFISDATLESAMRAVRQAIGDSGREQRFIQTLHGHGYRFVATVAEQAEVMAEEASRGEALTPVEFDRTLDAPTSLYESVEPMRQEAVPSTVPDAQAEPYVSCPHCHTKQPVTARFCEQCGASLGRVCPGCGAMVGTLVQFCSVCGTGLSTPPLTVDRSALAPSRAPGVECASQRVPPTPAPRGAVAERRQLTVLCCDLVASTTLAARLDPEAFREVLRAYHAACATVIERFDGHIAQYLGSGLLVYFGYPLAHEDAPQRAVRTGLGMVEAVRRLNQQRQLPGGFELTVPLQVRVGIHTGLVVIDEVGDGARQEWLALGEVPNLATGLQSLAAPETVVTSAATWRLVEGWFACQPLGGQTLAGLPQPVPVYRVLQETGAQSRLEVTGTRGLTPLIGREPEVALLQERWAQVKDGLGQVVLLSGEAGIGKSRLAETLRAQVACEGSPQIILRCSPFHTHSALFPVLVYLQQRAGLDPEEAPAAKLDKLEQMLCGYRLALEQVVPLFAALLAVPLGQRYPPVQLTPERQKQQTHEALVAWLLAEAERQPIFVLCEDLHWADPSTLELLNLWMTQVPMLPALTLLLFRPEFQPPWTTHAHCAQLTLPRFTRTEVEQMLAALADGTLLPAAIREQVIMRTDGVPLFVEELVKMLRESRLLQAPTDHNGRTPPRLPLTIPASLQDALMARLDHLGSARDLAQLGATWGREFTYAQMQSLLPQEETTLRQHLAQLVEAEILYQRGFPPQASYRFKHALIQETAYQSLVRSTRHAYHGRIAHVLATHFPETAATQPELLAHHYTEAGLVEQAIPYWQQAGEQAIRHSAHVEAASHFSTGLALLKTLPETPAHLQQELDLQLALGPALSAIKGYATPAVEQTYARAHVLCAEVGDTAQLFPTLWGLLRFYMGQGTFAMAREIGEQLVYLAERTADPANHLKAYDALVAVLGFMGECAAALPYMERGLALIDPTVERALALRQGLAPGVRCQAAAANVLGFLGFPTQAVRRAQEALDLARAVGHPYSLAAAHTWLTYVYRRRREVSEVLTLAESLVTLASAQGFPLFLGLGTCWRSWAHALLGEGAVALAELRQGMAIVLAAGQMTARPLCLVLLAEATGYLGQAEDGLVLLCEALTALEANARGDLLADAYRLQGIFLLQQAVPEAARAEACLQQALTVARRQQAKALELQAAMSLSHLWQAQGKRVAAQQLLAEVYGWFTEGFETIDLQEAKALLEELA